MIFENTPEKANKIHTSRHRFSYRRFKGRKNSSPTCDHPRERGTEHEQQAKYTYSIFAVAARRGGVRVVEVATDALHELIRPLRARLARRRVEPDELVRLALDHKTAVQWTPTRQRTPKGSDRTDDSLKLGRQHGAQDARERRELVEPPPVRRERGVGQRHAREGSEHETDERVEERRDLHAGGDGADELSEADTEDFNEDDDEQLEELAAEARGALAEGHGEDLENRVGPSCMGL